MKAHPKHLGRVAVLALALAFYRPQQGRIHDSGARRKHDTVLFLEELPKRDSSRCDDVTIPPEDRG